MRHLSLSTRGDPATYVGSVRKAMTAALRTFGVRLTGDQATELTQAMLEAIEAQKLVLLPHKPTKAMVDASMGALHHATRPSVGWVDTVTKHQWRLYTAMGALPDWREGMRLDAERRIADRERSVRQRAGMEATVEDAAPVSMEAA